MNTQPQSRVKLSESKPTLVLLVGLLSDRTIWDDVSCQLTNLATIRIFNFRGFDSISAMAGHVLATVTGPFALAGHSMGGRVAIEAYRHASSRISGLALFNTGVHARQDHEFESRGRLVSIARKKGMAAVTDEWLPPMLGAPPARLGQISAKLRAMVESYTPEEFARQTKALLERPDAESVLPAISVPTVLSSATADRWSPLSQHEEMQRRITNSNLEAIANAGHMAPVEQPEAAARILRHWFSALNQPPPVERR
jgi:pimeloyl-ACP methyl ester carboxylesterase